MTSPATILIERVICDVLTGADSLAARNEPTIDGQREFVRDRLTEPADWMKGTLQTIEVRLTLGPYSLDDGERRVSCWRGPVSDSQPFHLALIEMVRFHYGHEGARAATRALGHLGAPSRPCVDCVRVHGELPDLWLAQWPEGADWHDDLRAHLCDGCADDRRDRIAKAASAVRGLLHGDGWCGDVGSECDP